jgi:hypothetical protein
MGFPRPGGLKDSDTTASSGKSSSVRGFRVARKLTERPVTPMILHLLLVLPNLLLHPAHRLVERSLPIRPFAMGDEIMLVLGVDQDLAFHHVGREVECQGDRRDPLKVRQELFSFLNDCLLDIGP